MLNQSELQDIMHYSPDTGDFTWKSPIHGAVKRGDIAGSKNKQGYPHIQIGGTLYKAHRLAWLYMHGAFPEGWLDHINGDRADNRISNLRLASPSQNRVNSKIRSDSTSGYPGVNFSIPHGKWRVRVGFEGKRHHIGLFDTRELAHEAYTQAAKQYHGEFANLGERYV